MVTKVVTVQNGQWEFEFELAEYVGSGSFFPCCALSLVTLPLQELKWAIETQVLLGAQGLLFVG